MQPDGTVAYLQVRAWETPCPCVRSCHPTPTHVRLTHWPPFVSQHYAGGSAGRASAVRWVCEPPGMPAGVSSAIVTVKESKANGVSSYDILVGTREPAVCALIPTMSRLLAPHNKACVLHRSGGYWSYEVCLGVHVIQVRAAVRVTTEVGCLLHTRQWEFSLCSRSVRVIMILPPPCL